MMYDSRFLILGQWVLVKVINVVIIHKFVRLPISS